MFRYDMTVKNPVIIRRTFVAGFYRVLLQNSLHNNMS